MRETQWRGALNEVEVMGILTRGFSFSGGFGAGHVMAASLLPASAMVEGLPRVLLGCKWAKWLMCLLLINVLWSMVSGWLQQVQRR
jgi:hypothetical protein